MSDDSPDEIVREIHTSEGCKVTIKSKRGTGTRDQDEIKAELSAADPDAISEVAEQAADAVATAMAERRGETDEEGGE